ncbi:uncharacterized protein LOC123014832 [Tribolium madens]|uniref:uncharacterized protein LOC123014832 n=1 Tax=Tribolium madens TaxID=41895 RepID=UPI001CF747F1|nr:uncharacterized protein LOC123014832 [Tribolium madens]
MTTMLMTILLFKIIDGKNLIEKSVPEGRIIGANYLDQDGTPLLHMTKECLATYFISYIVPKGSSLLNTFNKVILRLVESGLTWKAF